MDILNFGLATAVGVILQGIKGIPGLDELLLKTKAGKSILLFLPMLLGVSLAFIAKSFGVDGMKDPVTVGLVAGGLSSVGYDLVHDYYKAKEKKHKV